MTDHTDCYDRTAVALRPIEMADADRVHEMASQERACRFQPWGPNTREETDSFVTEAARTWEQPEGARLVWAAASPALGVVGMGEIKRNTTACAEGLSDAFDLAARVDYSTRPPLIRALMPQSAKPGHLRHCTANGHRRRFQICRIARDGDRLVAMMLLGRTTLSAAMSARGSASFRRERARLRICLPDLPRS